MSVDMRQLLPFLDWGEIYRQQVHWSLREISGDKAELMQRDIVAYIDWALAFMKGENHNLAEGIALYNRMTSWQPEDFPLKVAPPAEGYE